MGYGNNGGAVSVGVPISEFDAYKADNVQQISDLQTQVNNLSAVTDPFYEECLNTDVGALLIVESGATNGQINLADVTPTAIGYTPITGDYVKYVYGSNTEIIQARGKFSVVNDRITNIETIVNSFFAKTIGKNQLNPSTIKLDVSFTSAGAETQVTGMCISDYISVVEGKTLYFSRLYDTGNIAPINVYKIVAYNASKAILSVSATNVASFVIPTGCACIQIAVPTVYVTTYGVQVEYDAITSWETHETSTSLNADNITVIQGNITDIQTTVSSLTAADTNVLFGKTLAICGDSITYGYASDLYAEGTETVGTYINTLPTDYVNYKADTVRKKTYGYYIAERNAMTLQINAVSGSTIAENADSATDGYAPAPFSRTSAGANRYTWAFDENTDYALLWFGANDSTYVTSGTMVIGTSADVDNKSLFGAYNFVIDYIKTNYPNIKVGLVVPWCTNSDVRNCIRNVGEYWGIPVLDWMGDSVPIVTPYGRDGVVVSTTVTSWCQSNFFGADSMHPIDNGYKYMATIIENYLKTL